MRKTYQVPISEAIELGTEQSTLTTVSIGVLTATTMSDGIETMDGWTGDKVNWTN